MEKICCMNFYYLKNRQFHFLVGIIIKASTTDQRFEML